MLVAGDDSSVAHIRWRRLLHYHGRQTESVSGARLPETRRSKKTYSTSEAVLLVSHSVSRSCNLFRLQHSSLHNIMISVVVAAFVLGHPVLHSLTTHLSHSALLFAEYCYFERAADAANVCFVLLCDVRVRNAHSL